MLLCDDDDSPLLPGDACAELANHRLTCQRCRRPSSVCLRASFPPEPLRTRGLVVVLQHPHEEKRLLASVPLLSACLSADALAILRCRTVRPGRSLLLDAVLDAAASGLPVFLLWPGAGAELPTRAAAASCTLRYGLCELTCDYVLLVPDGTWPQCSLLVRSLLAVTPLTTLRLPPVVHAGGDTRLRMEPVEGCCVTAEAVARVLAVLEDDAALAETLLRPLRAMVALQQTCGGSGKAVRVTARSAKLRLAPEGHCEV